MCQSGLGLLEPWPMKVLIDSGLSHHPLPVWFARWLPSAASSAKSIIVFAAAGALLLRVVASLLDIGNEYLKSRVNSGINLRFAGDLFEHLLRLSFTFHDRTTVGDSIYRINNDTSFVSTLIWSNFRRLLTSTAAFIGMLWIVIRLDWQLAILALAIAPIQYGAVSLYGRLFKAKAKRIRAMESLAASFMHEALSCLRVVKAFGQEKREHRRVDDQRWTALRAKLRLDVQQSFFAFGLRFVSKLDRSIILLIGGFHVLAGKLTIGELLVIIAYVNQLQEPLEMIGEVFQSMQSSLVSAERVLEILDVEPDIQDRPGAKTLSHVSGAIRFQSVSFGYEPERLVLHDVDLDVKPGQIVAIVGPTGAGKTTMASLVNRFYDPLSGRVMLDGQDLRELTIRTLRDNIALVLQESLLFTGTIRDNIAYGRPEADQDEIIDCARAANAHDFITGLPNGYNTEVGERGVRLSGGERQRIAIARAFLKNAPVLILDEPTSSVDARTEAVILEALDRLMEGRTVFVIAHRLSTIRYADQIVVLEKGRIVEHGCHDDLLRHNGLYAQLHRIQAGAFRQNLNIEITA